MPREGVDGPGPANQPEALPRDTFEVLISAPREPGASLPAPWASMIGPWDIPKASGRRPYVYVNFMVSRDGRASFNEPGNYSPLPLSMGHEHDSWLMGLLRARADAVLVGDGTVRADPGHVWRPEYVFPRGRAAFAQLRRQEGLGEAIPLVVLSLTGELPAGATQFADSTATTIIATTRVGAPRLERLAAQSAGVCRVHVLGDDVVEIARLMTLLRSKYGIRRLLCEGGPRVYGSLLAADAVDDEFLTISPMLLGNDATSPRPGIVEGARFDTATAPVSQLLAVVCSGDFIFLRSRYARRP